MLRATIFASLFLIASCAGYKTGNSSITPSQQEIKFSENSGNSFHEAVIVYGASTQTEGVAAEYQYISKLHGERGHGWYLIGQTLIKEQNKIVDVVEIQLTQSFDRRVFFFDASGFVGGE